ncbi:unnamed protein product [Mytilus coruscus]|uniref:Uncharacterized protein n=1 Tax=Mytilus coruscus TaxID=42192 RepID=A0A6J8AL22_MYTCO|nr:unnamed protein product [Mytilus coruscus]
MTKKTVLNYVKKPGSTAINILNDLPEDDKERYKWKFILETKFDEVEKALLHKKVDLHVTTAEGGPFFAIFDSTHMNGKVALLRVLHEWSFGLTAIEKEFPVSFLSKYKSGKKFQCYTTCNKRSIWLAGDKETIDMVTKEFEKETHTVENVHNTGISNDKESIEAQLREIQLTEGEQALIYLHRLWDYQTLRQKQIFINKEEETRYSAGMRLMSQNSDNEAIQQEVKDILKSLHLGLSVEKVSFSAAMINFLASEAVYKYVDNKLNCSRSNIKCAWYVNVNDRTVSLYSRQESDAKLCARDLENVLVHESIPVPPKLFETVAIKSSLNQLESKYNGKLRLKLSSTATTLHYICINDNISSFKRDLQNIFTTRTFEIFDSRKQAYCTMRFHLIKDSIEEKFKVSIKEEENKEKKKFKFVIQGSPKSVDAVYTELRTLVENVCIQVRDYKIDYHPSEVSDVIDQMPAEFEEIESHRVFKLIDLGGETLCHNWKLQNGSKIKILNADDNWLVKGSMLLRVEIRGKSVIKN